MKESVINTNKLADNNIQNVAEKIATEEFGRHVADLDFRDMKS
jgi:hypothetical protein